jgi:hypothetical protein
LWLCSNRGEVVPGRCRATNLCRYCQALYVVETLEMLWLDAAEYAPTLWAVLTAREHLTRVDCYAHLKQLRSAARKRWPDVQWFVQVEFQRRGALHLNLLIKGVPVEDADELRELLAERWCARVDAEPVGQWLGVIADAGGVTRYLQKTLAHGLKQEQAPPIGWRGHRTSQTRGYLVRPASVMRLEAKRSLRFKRELWKAINAGHEAHDVELIAHQAVVDAASVSWGLWRQKRPEVAPRAGGDGVPSPMVEAAWRWRDGEEVIRDVEAQLGRPTALSPAALVPPAGYYGA